MIKKIAATLLFTAALLASDPPREQKLQQAIDLMESQGDLAHAIPLFEEVARSSDHTLAARGLLYLGQAQERQDAPRARATYERIIKEFGNQTEAVTEAGRRLARLRDPARPAVRQMWVGSGVDDRGSPSSDGQSLAYIGEGGQMFIRDLVSGVNHRVTADTDPGFADRGVISPNGRQVAYAWYNQTDARYELRVVPSAGGPSRKVHNSPETGYLDLFGWSPNGQYVVVNRTMLDHSNQLALISISDGSIRTLKSLGWNWTGRASFSPDGNYIAYDLPSGDGAADRDIFVLALDGSQESRLVAGVANDYTPLWSADGAEIYFLSDRTTPTSLWAAPVRGGKANGPVVMIRSDVGPIRPMGVTRNGFLIYAAGKAIHRNIYVTDLDEQFSINSVPVLATERTIDSNAGGAWSPDGQYLAYYSFRREDRGAGASVLVLRNLSTRKEQDISLQMDVTRVPTTRPVWFPDGRSLLVTAVASSGMPKREFYRVEVPTGNVVLLHSTQLPGVAFTPDISPGGNEIFYVERVEGEGRRLVRFDLTSRTENILKRGALESFALSPDGRQIAYLINGTDSVVLEVMASGGGETHTVWQAAHRSAVFSTLTWAPDQQYLLYVAPDETHLATLWRVAVKGGTPTAIGGSSTAQWGVTQIHPGGRRMIFTTRETGRVEIWAMENLSSLARAVR